MPDITQTNLNKLVCEAVEAHNFFQNKEGEYSRPIWESKFVDQQKSHRWHETYSAQEYSSFTKVASRVTSKILGIGSAERSWGDVKQLKNGKRSHLGNKKIEKNSIIYGQASLMKARIEQEYCPNTWDFSDLDNERLIAELEEYMLDKKDPTLNNSDESNDKCSEISDLFATSLQSNNYKKVHMYEESDERKWIKKEDGSHWLHLVTKYKGL